jgi:type IV pilus assembly protein PilO
MKLPIREMVLGLLLVSMPVSAWWFVFKPGAQSDAQMRRQIELKQAKLRELNQATGSLGDLRREITELQKGINSLKARLPSEKEIDKVLKEIWSIAEANRLTTKSIRTVQRGDSETGAFAEQPINVQVEGDYRGFYCFLQALENQPRIIQVHKLSLNRPEKKGEAAENGHVLASFAMSIFFERSGQ